MAIPFYADMMQLTHAHGMVGALSNSKDVRRDFITPLQPIYANSSLSVDWEPSVWVDSNAEKSRIGVDELLNISCLQIE